MTNSCVQVSLWRGTCGVQFYPKHTKLLMPMAKRILFIVIVWKQVAYGGLVPNTVPTSPHTPHSPTANELRLKTTSIQVVSHNKGWESLDGNIYPLIKNDYHLKWITFENLSVGNILMNGPKSSNSYAFLLYYLSSPYANMHVHIHNYTHTQKIHSKLLHYSVIFLSTIYEFLWWDQSYTLND